MMKYLEEHGYVVIKEVANVQQIGEAKGKLWEFLEANNEGMKRSEPQNWI